MYHIIVNPASRSGRGGRIWKEVIKPALAQKQVTYQAYFSEKPGEVIRISKEIASAFLEAHPYSEEACKIIILGGDGTVNETLQGITSYNRFIFGYIPTGSSNDLARDIGVPRKPLAALERILSARDNADMVHPMDRGIVKTDTTTRSFCVSTGLGFDAAVCEEAMNSKIKDTFNRIGLGKLTYLGIALKQLFSAKPVSCEIYLDDKDPIYIKNILFAATMNHRFEGGGFKFCPSADYTDGIFDLCVVGNLPKPLLLLALPTAFFGKHYMFKGVDHYRAKRVRIKTSSPLWLHTDGEVHERADKLEINCAQGDIRFII